LRPRQKALAGRRKRPSQSQIEESDMSELETARAGVFLSVLALTLTWLLLNNDSNVRTPAQAEQPLAVCAATHGAICEPAPVDASQADAAQLGEIVVTAARLPTPLGRLVVVASRIPDGPPGNVRLAERRLAQSVVVQSAT
jgi:hypothetical protein